MRCYYCCCRCCYYCFTLRCYFCCNMCVVIIVIICAVIVVICVVFRILTIVVICLVISHPILITVGVVIYPTWQIRIDCHSLIVWGNIQVLHKHYRRMEGLMHYPLNFLTDQVFVCWWSLLESKLLSSNFFLTLWVCLIS